MDPTVTKENPRSDWCRMLPSSAAAFMLAVILLPVFARAAQNSAPGYMSDNSDWWSRARKLAFDQKAIMRQIEPRDEGAVSSFRPSPGASPGRRKSYPRRAELCCDEQINLFLQDSEKIVRSGL